MFAVNGSECTTANATMLSQRTIFMNIPLDLNTNIVVLANMFLGFLGSLVLKQIFGHDKQIARIQLLYEQWTLNT